MKILIPTPLYPPEEGGPATYSKLLADELPRRGFEVKIVAFRDVRHFPKVIRHIIYFFKILAGGWGVDCIYAQDAVSVGFPTALANLFLRKKLLIKVVGDHVWEQGCQRFGIEQLLDEFPLRDAAWPWYLNFLRTLQQYTLRRADVIVTPSQYLRKIVMKWGISTERIVCIYNGVDFQLKPVLPDTHPSNLIVVSARLVPWKGIAALIDIVAAEPTWSLAIIGDGPLRAGFHRQAKEKGAQKRIRFLGALPHSEAFGWYSVADVFVLNSSYEGLSHTLLEAMYLGLPIIATDVGGNPELIVDGTSGVLVPAGDAATLKEKIRILMSDEEFAGKIGRGAALRAQDFSTGRTIAALCALLKKYV